MREPKKKPDGIPEHLGLAYDVWATIGDNGKIDDKERDQWLDGLVQASGQPRFLKSYRIAYERWLATLAGPGHHTFVAHTHSRLLIGHGQPAPTEVGLTLHHTWGVPVIPGSALEGLLAHYVDTCYGPDRQEDGSTVHDSSRQPYAGPRYDTRTGRAIEQPGSFHTRLFGAPPVIDPLGNAHPARRGELIVHDAWWVPPSDEAGQPFLLRDVITPHHATYYRSHAGRDPSSALPNDYDDPIPISFVTIRPRTAFLVALSCRDPALLRRAVEYLAGALTRWGVGAKTAAGYGRLAITDSDQT